MTTTDKLSELACRTENLARFEDTFVSVLHSYNAPVKDREMLAFIGCATMTDDALKDKERLAGFLKTVQERTSSVWQYIDEEMYMIDFALDVDMLQLLMLLHEVILTTQTIEKSVKYSLQYHKSMETFFSRLFANARLMHIIPESVRDPQMKVWTFLCLMIRKEPVCLGLWGDWANPADLQIPLNWKLLHSAYGLGIVTMQYLDNSRRERITEYFRRFFPEDPAKGFFTLLAYADKIC